MSKKKRIVRKVLTALLVLVVLIGIAHILGVGYWYSSAAANDLKIELTEICGEEYTGKATANGTQDMRFEITPRTFFITRERFRAFFGLDYKFTCKVIYTDYVEGREPQVRTITYMGVDEPLNAVRAHLLSDTKKQQSIRAAQNSPNAAKYEQFQKLYLDNFLQMK